MMTASDPLQAGAPAPDFELLGDDEQRHLLADFRGQLVILYFYPKDATPGCTQEACDFRDLHAQAGRRGVVIIGVSPDSVASHRRFKEKQGLPFLLLSDPGAQVAQRYGAYGEKNMYGKKTLGLLRSTFVIDPAGRIAAVFRKVAVKGHAAAVLAALPG